MIEGKAIRRMKGRCRVAIVTEVRKSNSTPAPFTKTVKGCGAQKLPSGPRGCYPP
jgi:hypothetical protein